MLYAFMISQDSRSHLRSGYHYNYDLGCDWYFWCGKKYRLGNPNAYNIVVIVKNPYFLQYWVQSLELDDEKSENFKHKWFFKFLRTKLSTS